MSQKCMYILCRFVLKVLTQLDAYNTNFKLKFETTSNWSDTRLKFKNLQPKGRYV